jgi:hypothetical protein
MTMLKSRLPSQKDQQKMSEAMLGGRMGGGGAGVVVAVDWSWDWDWALAVLLMTVLSSSEFCRYRRHPRKNVTLSEKSARWETRSLGILRRNIYNLIGLNSGCLRLRENCTLCTRCGHTEYTAVDETLSCANQPQLCKYVL